MYIAGDRLGYGIGLWFLSYTEIESRDPSPSMCNVNMFCIVQCNHWVWNESESVPESVSVNVNEPLDKEGEICPKSGYNLKGFDKIDEFTVLGKHFLQ